MYTTRFRAGFVRSYVRISAFPKPSRFSCWNTSSSPDCAERALSARSASEMNAAALIHIPGIRPAPFAVFGRISNLAHPRPRMCYTLSLSSAIPPTPQAHVAPATVNIGFFGAIYEKTPRIQARSFNLKPNPCTKAVSWLVRFAECFLTP